MVAVVPCSGCGQVVRIGVVCELEGGGWCVGVGCGCGWSRSSAYLATEGELREALRVDRVPWLSRSSVEAAGGVLLQASVVVPVCRITDGVKPGRGATESRAIAAGTHAAAIVSGTTLDRAKRRPRRCKRRGASAATHRKGAQRPSSERSEVCG